MSPVEDNKVQGNLDSLREWLKTQPHIPEVDPHMLRRFLHSCYYDLAATKKCMELFYTIRSNTPKIFNNRDPLSPELKKLFEYAYSVFISNGKDNVRIWKLDDPGMNNYDHPETTKAFMMMADVSFMEEVKLPDRDIVILDFKDMTLKLLTKINLSVLRTSAQYLQEALPVRLKQVHILNAPSYVDKFYAVVKPFLRQDMLDLINFHKPNSETIFEHLGRELIPRDYGGTAPSMGELMTQWIKRLENQREFLVNDKLWRADDSKRSKDSKRAQDPVNGSFKTLSID